MPLTTPKLTMVARRISYLVFPLKWGEFGLQDRADGYTMCVGEEVGRTREPIMPALARRLVMGVAWGPVDMSAQIQIPSQPASGIREQLTSNFVLPAIIFWNPIPTPSITASNTAHPIAPFLADLNPPRIARAPPVRKPAPIAFHGSSFCRTPLTAQSAKLNMPPQAPKLPPNTGARILTAVMAPIRRSPYGLLRKPLIPCQIVPPIAC